MADRLELDAAITGPIVDQVVGELTAATAPMSRVLDAGCGPGAVAVRLATLLNGAHVTALDSNAALLGRVRHRADEAGASRRVDTVEGDLEHSLPHMPAVDLVWAGMVLHHVAKPLDTLRRLHAVLRPGGTLVMVEFGDVPRVLPENDPLLADGTWQRFQLATTETLNDRLGLDPVAIDWPAHLTAAGFTDITDRGFVAHHAAPLGDMPRAWLVPHILRGLEMAAERIADDDAARLRHLADQVPHRDDLEVRAARRVVTARRP